MSEETKTIDISQRLFMLFGGLVLIIIISMVGQMIYQFQSLPQNAPHELNVTGEGKAYAKPDVATITFGVHTEAAKSQDAVSQNNQTMDKVIKAIKDQGVEDKDIQTTSYNLYPQYDYTQYGSRFKGYSLDQQVLVKIRNFDKINDVLDKAAANGANTIGSLQFTVDDMEKVKSEARAKAIAQAKEKADSITSSSGLHIIRLTNVSESSYPTPGPIAYGMGGGPMMAKDSSAPSIQTGQLEVDLTVNLTYAIQ